MAANGGTDAGAKLRRIRGRPEQSRSIRSQAPPAESPGVTPPRRPSALAHSAPPMSFSGRNREHARRIGREAVERRQMPRETLHFFLLPDTPLDVLHRASQVVSEFPGPGGVEIHVRERRLVIGSVALLPALRERLTQVGMLRTGSVGAVRGQLALEDGSSRMNRPRRRTGSSTGSSSIPPTRRAA